MSYVLCVYRGAKGCFVSVCTYMFNGGVFCCWVATEGLQSGRSIRGRCLLLSSNCQSPVWEIGQGKVLLVVGLQLRVSSLGDQSGAVPCVEQQLPTSSLGDWSGGGASCCWAATEGLQSGRAIRGSALC